MQSRARRMNYQQPMQPGYGAPAQPAGQAIAVRQLSARRVCAPLLSLSFPLSCAQDPCGRTRCSSIARIAVLAPAQVGGRNILGYVQAQRAVTDATYCVQRWPALKLEAGTYSAPSPRANSASFPLCSPRLACATHSDMRPSRHAFGMHSGQHRQEH